MDRRTKILAGLLGAAVLYGLFSSVIYPTFIQKWLMLDEQIVKRQAELDGLVALDEQVKQAKYEYRDLAARNGSFDMSRIDTDIRERLNQLIEEHKLNNQKVTPSRVVEDRKSGLQSKSITVAANCTLESAIKFLKDLAELPHLARVGNVSLSPASSSSRRDMTAGLLNIRVPIEIWVLPQQRIVGRLGDSDLETSDIDRMYVRHDGRDYSRIWSGEPFSDYVPLSIQALPTYNVQTHQPLTLEASAAGGRGSHTFQWSPEDGLTNAATSTPQVDTSKPGSKRYSVTVTDASGKTAAANVAVTIREPPKLPDPVVQAPQPREVIQPPPAPVTWPDGQYKELRMALLQNVGDRRLDEFMVCDTRNQTNDYYKAGDSFDGGELIFVHQSGGLVHRKNEYFVYPLGSNLAQALPLADAGAEFPELQRAAEYHRQAIAEARRPKPTPEAAAPAPAPEGGAIPLAPSDSPAAMGEAVPGPPFDEQQAVDRRGAGTPPAPAVEKPVGETPKESPRRTRPLRKPR